MSLKLSDICSINLLSSIASSVSIVRVVEFFYSINVLKCELLQSKIHDVYLIHSQNSKFIFKIYGHSSQSADKIAKMSALLNLVKKIPNCYDLMPVIQSASGSEVCIDLIYPEGVRIGVLFTYIEGVEVDHKLSSHGYLYGQYLAFLHNICPPKYKQSSCLVQVDLYGLPISRESRNFISNKLNWLSNNLTIVNDLTVGLIHGDVHGGNAVVHDGRLSFIDPDDIRFDYTAFDLISFKLTCITHLGLNYYQSVFDAYIKYAPNFHITSDQEIFLLWMREMEVLLRYLSRYQTLGTSLVNDNLINKRISCLSRYLKGN